jgi:cytochrome c oxidase assembly protein subunit 15
MAESQNTVGVQRFAIATALTTVALLVAGALVTSNDAADSVPDWPLAYGRIIPPLIGGIRYEYAHRVVAALVAILTTILAIWLSRVTLKSPARRWGWIAFALVLVQAFLVKGKRESQFQSTRFRKVRPGDANYAVQRIMAFLEGLQYAGPR